MYRRIRNWVIIGSLLILVAAAGRYRLNQGLPLLPGGASDLAATMPADTTLVERMDFQVVVSATGSISPVAQAALLFPGVGKVARIAVAEGDRVTAGTVLAELDTTQIALALADADLALALQEITLEALTAAPREVDLAVARAAVYAASTQLTAAQTGPDAAQEEIARLQYEIARNQLWQSQLQRDGTRQTNEDLDRLRSAIPFEIPGEVALPAQLVPNLRSAEAGVNQAEYGVAIAEQQLTQAQNATASNANIAAASAAIVSAQAQLDRLLEGPDATTLAIADAQLQNAYLSIERVRHQLQLAQLVAPFSGVVSAVNLVAGEAPPTNRAAVELLDDSAYTIDLAVDELDVVSVRPGQPVQVVLDALPGETISGTVVRIADVATNLGGLITYTVEVRLDPAAIPLRTGMSATATIVVDEADDVLAVRNRFIRIDRRTGQAFVTVQQADGSLAEREVVPGRRNETFSEITSGVNEGDVIVLEVRNALSEFGF